MTTGTFKYDTDSGVFVFRSETGDSVSYNGHSGLWEVWRAGGNLQECKKTLAGALAVLDCPSRSNS